MKPSCDLAGSTGEKHPISRLPMVTPQFASPELKVDAWIAALAEVTPATATNTTTVKIARAFTRQTLVLQQFDAPVLDR
jgi:hypothetical protein